MAAMDYGVIVMKDGVLDRSWTTHFVAAEFVLKNLNGLTFYRNSISDANFHKQQKSYNPETKSYDYKGEVLRITLYEDLQAPRKKVKHWMLHGIVFKTKCHFSNLMVTTFRFEGHSYKVIQGFDVGDPNQKRDFWYSRSRRRLLKLMK